MCSEWLKLGEKWLALFVIENKKASHLVESMGLIYSLRTGLAVVAKRDFAVYIKPPHPLHLLQDCTGPFIGV